jgi:hypothetical protein
MTQGIRLSLMIGAGVPIPVGQDIIEALRSVRVTITTEGPSGFQLTFSLNKRSPLHTLFLLTSGAAIPLVRVLLIATVRGDTVVLMDGVMTNHEVGGGGTTGEPTLTITGEDLSRVMDYIDFSGLPYPAMPIFARVNLIIAKYSFLGIIPLVVPTVFDDVPNPLDYIPRQQGKDLPYLRMLADQVGYVFYVNPGPAPGTSTAYFGPEIKVGVPQPALNMDMDAETNVESLTFSYDSEKAALPVLLIYNSLTKVPIPIPIPDVTPLNPPLGLVPPIPKKIEPLCDSAKFGPVRGALLGLAKAAKRTEVVRGNGTLDVLRYGRVLRARQLVGVRGAGAAFDGLYYVRSVTHNIERGKYMQDFELSRNGLLSTLPKVPV